MLRPLVLPFLLLFAPTALAQEAMDPLRSASDKAQERFRDGPRGGDARSVTGTDKVFTTVSEMPRVLRTDTLAGHRCSSALPDTVGRSSPLLMRFIVERDGSLSAIEPLGDARLDEAARCELRRMQWAPGRQGGVPVRVRTSLLLYLSQ
ncbi:MAG TPA: hypothetical protein VGE21_04910 [Flavobacteriales bacterium]